MKSTLRSACLSMKKIITETTTAMAIALTTLTLTAATGNPTDPANQKREFNSQKEWEAYEKQWLKDREKYATPAFPVRRVLTDTDGRKLDVVILEKSATNIKCQTPDNRTVAIQIAKLSARDIQFIADRAARPEIARMQNLPRQKLPYPVMFYVLESDGSYVYHNPQIYQYERIGTKLRMLLYNNQIWEVDDTDTFESRMAADPKFAEKVKKDKEDPSIVKPIAGQTRVCIKLNTYDVPSGTYGRHLFDLIAKRDPRMQSFVDAVGKNAGSNPVPANCEFVGTDAIAKAVLLQLGKSDLEDLPELRTFSLKLEKAELGVRGKHRQSDISYSAYPAYHLLDFYMKKGLIRRVTFEQFLGMAAKRPDGTYRVDGNDLLNILAKMEPGLKIRVRQMRPDFDNQNSVDNINEYSKCDYIFRKFLVSEIAAGRPVLLGINDITVDHRPVNSRQSILTEINNDLAITVLESTGFEDKDLQGVHIAYPEYLQTMDIGRPIINTAVSFEFINPAAK
jgi:hypothetical protein